MREQGSSAFIWLRYAVPLLALFAAVLLPDLAHAQSNEQALLSEITSRMYVSRWLLVITCLWAAACWWVTRFAEKPMDATTGALLAATWGVLPLLCKLYLDLGAQLVHEMPLIVEIALFFVIGALIYMIFLTAYAPDIVENERDSRDFDTEGRRRRPRVFRTIVYLALLWPMVAIGAIIHFGGGDGFTRPFEPLTTQTSVIMLLAAFVGVVLAVLVRTNLSSYQMPPLPRLMLLLYALAGALMLPALGVNNISLPPLMLPLAALYGTFACVLFLHGFMNFREEELWREAEVLRSLHGDDDHDEEEEEEPTLLPHDLPIGWLFLIGVAYPAITLLFSLPRPDAPGAPYAPNIFMIFALVPVLLTLSFVSLWRPGEKNPPRWSVLLVMATLGAVSGIGLYVLLGYAPVTIIRAAFGQPQGLLLAVISLIFSGVVALTLAHIVLTRSSFTQWKTPLHWTFRIFAIILALSLLLPDATAMVRRLTIISSLRDSGQDLRLMQLVGEETALLDAAYTGETLEMRNSPRTIDWIESIVAGLKPGETRRVDVTRDQARGLYFRLTGESITAQPRPADLRAFPFDADRASGAVGSKLQGIRLTGTRVETLFIPPDDEMAPQSRDDAPVWKGHLRYTWVNDSAVQDRDEQVRMLLHMPIGSRITAAKWIGGEPPKTEQAQIYVDDSPYTHKRVSLIEPPKLRILSVSDTLVYLAARGSMRAGGGALSVELDVTLPRRMTAKGRRVILPRILEHNAEEAENLSFLMVQGMDHWPTRTVPMPPIGGPMPGLDLSGARTTRPTTDRLQQPPVAVVIDKSRALRPYADDITQWLQALPPDTAIIHSGDEPEDTRNDITLNPEDFTGGKDAGSALALGLARGLETGRPVIWLTGSQPVYSRENIALLTRVVVDEHPSRNVKLYVVTEGVGSNLYLFSPQLLRRLQQIDLVMVDRLGDLAYDINRILPQPAGLEAGEDVPPASHPAPASFILTDAQTGDVETLRDPSATAYLPQPAVEPPVLPVEIGLAPRAGWFLLTLFLLLKTVFVIRRTWLEVLRRSRKPMRAHADN